MNKLNELYEKIVPNNWLPLNRRVVLGDIRYDEVIENGRAKIDMVSSPQALSLNDTSGDLSEMVGLARLEIGLRVTISSEEAREKALNAMGNLYAKRFKFSTTDNEIFEPINSVANEARNQAKINKTLNLNRHTF